MSITVVIPLYNKAGTIGRALDSVLAQTLLPDEILVVDDGSIDGGAEVVAARTDATLRLIRQPNGGVSVARNRGVAEARSDWVAFLDADDEWLPGFLAAVSGMAARAPEVGVVFSNLCLSSAAEAWLSPGPSGIIRNYFDFVVARRGRGATSSSVMIRVDVLRRVGGFPDGQTHGEDLTVWTRVAWDAPYAYVPDVLARYHVMDSGRAMQAGSSRVAEGLSRCAQMCRDQLRAKRVREDLVNGTRAYAQLLESMCARELKDAGHPIESLKTLARSFRFLLEGDPFFPYFRAVVRSMCPVGLLELRRLVPGASTL